MANCSIPNSTLATGRTSTTSSRRSRRLNSASSSFFEASRLAEAIGPWTLRFLNAQRSTLNAQHSINTIERWALDACSRFIGVGRWTFSSFWRVKGAWWPSRSSKPSSPCKRRGRFDSYPLRSFRAVPVAVSLCETRTSPTGRRLQRSLVKGGESDVT
jgi:hypothetical protein